MAISIDMEKLDETFELVSYKFITSVPFREYIYENRKIRYEHKDIVGYCIFNKKTEEFVLDVNKTDESFFEDNKYYAELVNIRLLRFNRVHKEFPDKTGIYS